MPVSNSYDKNKTCLLKSLPADRVIQAATRALRINPNNAPRQHLPLLIANSMVPPTIELAVLVDKYWGIGGVNLTVGFLEPTSAALRNRILSHMNAWAPIPTYALFIAM